MAGQQFNIDLNLTAIGGGLGGGFGTLRDSDGSTTAVAKFLSPLGNHVNKIGLNFATLGASVTKLIGGFQFLGAATNQLIGKMTAFSPDLQRARSINEIRDIQQNLRLARESGPELARLALSQGDIARKIEELTTKILVAFTPLLSKMVDTTGKIVDGVVATKDKVSEAVTGAEYGYAQALIRLSKLTGTTEQLHALSKWWIAKDQEKAAKEAARIALDLKQIDGFLDPAQVDEYFNTPKKRDVPPQPDVSGFFNR